MSRSGKVLERRTNMPKSGFDFPYSPGPWRWADNGSDLLDANGQKLLEISDLQSDADANIVVAGPALVAACRRMWQALLQFGPTDDGTPAGKEVEDAMDEMRDALLFAKYGEPPGEVPDVFEEG
jgi:hypothetical protein